MRKSWAAGFAALILMSVAATFAAQVEVLPNGVTIAVEENHSAPVAAVRFYVKVGSVYEGEYLGAGISHFVEHCVSEGTPTRTKEQIDSLKESLGNDCNAYTSSGQTCYYLTTAGEYVKRAAELVADYVFHPSFPVEAVKTQRGIIKREITMGDDEPSRRIWNMFAQTMFRVHPARCRIIGYEQQFDMLQRADLVAFHNATYKAENVVVVVVGDFEGEEVMAYLKQLLGSEPKAAARRAALPVEPEQLAPRRRVQTDEGLSRAYLFVGWRTVDLFSPDLCSLDVAAFVLGHGKSSRLVSKLRDELGLVDSISAFSYTPSYDAGIFGISAVLDAANLQAAEVAIAEEMARLVSEEVPANELQKVITQKAAEIIYAQETIEGRATVLGSDLVSTGDADFSRLYIDGIRKVTAAEVRRVAAEYFRPEKLNTAVLGPPAIAETTATETEKQLVGSGQIVSHRLDNGMLVLVQEAHHSPTVSMLAGFKGGVRYESEQTNGLSNLMAAMLTRGTENRTYQQISTSIDEMAAVLAPFSGRNTFGLQAQCTSDNFAAVLEIFADCIMRPSFPPEQLERQRQLMLAAISARADDVDAVAFDLLAANLYQAHPYRMPRLGRAETVAALSREQLVEFHSRYTRPNGMVLAILGDVKAAETIELVEAQFADFVIGEIMPPPIPQEPAPQPGTVKTVARDQQQAIIVYGFPGPTINAEDRYARDVMTAVLAGMPMPGGRLHDALRGAELVYATWAYAMPGIETGHYVIYAGTEPEKVAETRATSESVITQLAAEGPSAEELARGKSMAIAARQLSIQSNLDRAQTIVLDELYKLGFDNYLQYAENIEAVTAEQVRQVAVQLLDIDTATVIVTEPK